MTFSDRLRQFFHDVSVIRPSIWILIYLAMMPVFAWVYYILPDSEFHIPMDGATTYGSWLYYSIVTITTLGLGDYTPAHGLAQTITAIEVICGIAIFGFFLNAVGAMRSERDVSSAIARQQAMHREVEKGKLLKNAPQLIHKINRFMAYCYILTTPTDKRTATDMTYDKHFYFKDMRDLYQPSGLLFDNLQEPAIEGFLRCAREMSLYLDSLQMRLDMSLWPALLEDCFTFVANTQIFNDQNNILHHPEQMVSAGKDVTVRDAEKIISNMIQEWKGPIQVSEKNSLTPVVALYYYIKENAEIARRIEMVMTNISTA